jgi:hypothetical protein
MKRPKPIGQHERCQHSCPVRHQHDRDVRAVPAEQSVSRKDSLLGGCSLAADYEDQSHPKAICTAVIKKGNLKP